jgi:hypothetical protein
MKPASISAHVAGAGLFGGAIAWALHQQIGYVIAAWSCGNAPLFQWIVSGAAIAILSFGALLSGLALRRFRATPQTPALGPFRARRFLAVVAILAALLFLFAILLQAAAFLFLPGCVG